MICHHADACEVVFFCLKILIIQQVLNCLKKQCEKRLLRNMNILCLCTGNSCRSIMAEALLRRRIEQEALNDVFVMSAGSKPTGKVHPRALSTLVEAGIDVTGLESSSWDALPAKPDVVISLCASAAAESCPAYIGGVRRLDWGMPDPDRAEGDDMAVQSAFDATLQALEQRVEAFLNDYQAHVAKSNK